MGINVTSAFLTRVLDTLCDRALLACEAIYPGGQHEWMLLSNLMLNVREPQRRLKGFTLFLSAVILRYFQVTTNWDIPESDRMLDLLDRLQVTNDQQFVSALQGLASLFVQTAVADELTDQRVYEHMRDLHDHALERVTVLLDSLGMLEPLAA